MQFKEDQVWYIPVHKIEELKRICAKDKDKRDFYAPILAKFEKCETKLVPENLKCENVKLREDDD